MAIQSGNSDILLAIIASLVPGLAAALALTEAVGNSPRSYNGPPLQR